MRKILKILHTLGAVGTMGALATMVILFAMIPDPSEVLVHAWLRVAVGRVAEWLLLPSVAVVLVSGLLAMGANDRFHGAGWVWAKLLSGIIMFEGTLVAVLSPARRAADTAAAVLAGEADAAALQAIVTAEWASALVILGVSTFNVVFGVWRPRFSKPEPAAEAS